MSLSSFRPFLLLDRDGTLIVERDYLSDPAQVEIVPGAAEVIRAFNEAGWGVAVVTNQSGVARGYFDMDAVQAVNRRVTELLNEDGAIIDGWYICPDAPDAPSARRKPAPGMGLEIARDLGAVLSESIVVGDKESDLGFGRAIGAKTVLVRTGYGHRTKGPADLTLESLADLTVPAIKAIFAEGCQTIYTKHFEEAEATVRATKEQQFASVLKAVELLSAVYRSGGKLLLCGNGGSAADCQHIAAELVCRLSANFERPSLPAISLSTDTSILTAWSNDYEFDSVFARQVEGLGRPGDALLAISTSGNSKSILHAVATAKQRGMFVIGSGGMSGQLKELSDVYLGVPGASTMRIQESQLILYHVLCDLLERSLFGSVDGA